MRATNVTALAGCLLAASLATAQLPATAAPATGGSGDYACTNGTALTVSFVNVQRIAFVGNGAVDARAFVFSVEGQVHIDGGNGLPDFDGAVDETQPPNMNGRLIKPQSLTNTVTCSSAQTFTQQDPMVESAGPDDLALLGLDAAYLGQTLTFIGTMTNTVYLTSQQVAARS